MTSGVARFPPGLYDEYFKGAEIIATTSAYSICKHKHGWYYTVKFLCFKNKLFYCEDCQCFIEKTGWKINWW